MTEQPHEVDDWTAALAASRARKAAAPAPLVADAEPIDQGTKAPDVAPPAPAQPAPAAPRVAETPAPSPRPAPTVAPVSTATLSETAMLVDFTRTGWSAAIRDANITRQVIDQAGATDRAGHWYKRLMPENAPALKGVRQAIQAAYEDHMRRTLPWMDSGPRMLASAEYAAYTQSQREHAGRIESAKARLRAEYADLVEQARAHLGATWNEADYPTVDDVVGRFAAGFRVTGIPDPSKDFRMNVGEAERRAIQTQYEEWARETVTAGRKEIHDRVTDAVRHFLDRMTTYTGGQTGSFRDTLVSGMRDLAGLLPSLNVTADPEIGKLADRLTAELASTDAQTLRESPAAREKAAKSAEAILADMSAFIA